MTIRVFDWVLFEKIDSVPKPNRPQITKTIIYNYPFVVVKDMLKIEGDIVSFDVDKKSSELKLEIIKKV